MSWKSPREYCGIKRFRHMTRMLYGILVMLLTVAVAFPIVPAAQGNEVDPDSITSLEQTQEGAGATNEEQDVTGEQSEGNVEEGTSEGDIATGEAETVEGENSNVDSSGDGDNANAADGEGTPNTDASNEEAAEPQANSAENGAKDGPATPTSGPNSDVGTVSADAVGFDVNDERIFEIPGVAVKEQGNRAYHLFQYLVDKQYPFAITNGDRSQIMVYSPDQQISSLKDAFDWKIKVVGPSTTDLNSNGIRFFSKSAKDESGDINGSVPKDGPASLIHRGEQPGADPVLWRTQGCTAKGCSGDAHGKNRPAGSLVMNDEKDADGYIRLWRNNGFIALLTAEDGTPYFGLVDQESVYANPEVEQSTHLHIYYFDDSDEATKPIKAERLANTTVNMFDYWVDEGENGGRNAVDFLRCRPEFDVCDGSSTSDDWESWDTGINNNHEFKFRANSAYEKLPNLHMNKNNSTIVQGILANTLGEDGYPRLAGDSSLIADPINDTGKNTSTESLAYLFNPTVATNGNKNYKASFSNVQGLFQKDQDGFWYYNSLENYAEVDETTNQFKLYAIPGTFSSTGNRTLGQFYPFNDFNTARNASSRVQNHWFGMSMTTQFAQMYDGHTDESKKTPMSFSFSGDDDVWIFIDDVLVADIGGIAGTRKVTIDFTDGSVNYQNQDGAANVTINDTTIADQFAKANRAGDTSQWNGKTFANGTYHTLKFYYFERGNTDSNMSLSFNFLDMQPTSIYKVDQFGKALAGAEFGAYAANADGQYLTDVNGSPVTASATEDPLDSVSTKEQDGHTVHTTSKGATWYYDEDWNIHYARADGTGGTITNLYHGRTDEQGSMPFISPDKTPYTLADLRTKFGEYFMLREVQIPAGYRTVSDDIWMQVDGDILRCLDTYQSGVWSSPDAKVTALKELTTSKESSARIAGGTVDYASIMSTSSDSYTPEGRYVKPYTTSGLDLYNINYYDPEHQSSKGTLFAAVLKRNGKSVNETEFQSMSCNDWDVVQGSDSEGYTMRTVPKDGDNLEQAIEVAKTYKDADGKYSHVFALTDAGMQVNLEELPGDQAQYYTYIFNNVRQNWDSMTEQERADATNDVEYVVAYYWTSADSLDEAVPSNTVRVISHDMSSTSLEGDSPVYHEFTTQWGATIEVPNVENRLIFRNLTYDKVPVNTDGQDAAREYNGSYFALYSVGEAVLKKDDGDKHAGETRMFYWATGTDGDKVGIYLNADLKYDGQLSDIAYLVDTDPSSPTYGQRTGEIGSYLINQKGEAAGDLGDITVKIGNTTYTIEPARNAENNRCVKKTREQAKDDKDDQYFIEGGMNYFNRLYEGDYVLRQITAPEREYGKDGAPEPSGTAEGDKYRYAINITETMVRIDSSAIYANAGGDTNGVLVGNGAGYLVKTLNQFALQGGVDETLAWIAMFLRVNYAQNFKAFDGFANGSETGNAPWGAASRIDKGESGISRSTTQKLEDAMVTYLQYDPNHDADKTLFDYVPNADQSSANRNYTFCTEINGEKVCTGLGDGEGQDSQNEDDKKMRLYTDEGWSMLNIYQDYSFGTNPDVATGHSVNSGYTKLLDTEITPLFSNSTFVVVYNSPSTTPQIKKVEEGSELTTTVLLTDEQKTQLDELKKLDKNAENKTCVDVLEDRGRPKDKKKYEVPSEEELGNLSGEDKKRLFTCLVGYETPVAEAQFRISKTVQVDGESVVQYWTGPETRTWSETENEAAVFTSDAYGKVLENLALKAYDTSEPPKQIVYTIEEVTAPEGYVMVGGTSVQFSLYNWEGNEEGSRVRIKLAGNDERRTLGVNVAPDGSTLYIENAKQPQIVKVEEGSEVTTTVLLNDIQLKDLGKDGKDKTCVDVLANPKDYQVATQEEIDKPANKDVLLTCLVGYDTVVEDAKFQISKDENGITLYYGEECEKDDDGKKIPESCKVGWYPKPGEGEKDEHTLQLTSDEFGQVITLDRESFDPKVTYTITETEAAPGYEKMLPKGSATFTLGAANRFNITEGTTGVRYSHDGMVMYIENEPGFELPSSGGKGLLWWMLIVGTLLAGLGVGFAYHQRRQMSE